MSVPQASRVPDVNAALVALGETVKTAGALGAVSYGPVPRAATKGKVSLEVFVGPRAADATLTEEGFDPDYVEAANVGCRIHSWSGGTGPDAVKGHAERVNAALSALKDALKADPTLGGVCGRAHLGPRQVWASDSTSKGAFAQVEFSVRAESWI